MAADEAKSATKYCPLCGREYREGEVCEADGAVLIQSQPEERFVDAAESMSHLDLEIGADISFGADRHQGSKKLWGTALDGWGSYQVLELAGP